MILRVISGVFVTVIGVVTFIGDWFSEGAASEAVGAPGWLVLFVGLLLLESASEKR